MLSAHTRQSSKQVLTVLYILSTYSTRFNILLYFIGHCSAIYAAEDVELLSEDHRHCKKFNFALFKIIIKHILTVFMKYVSKG